MGNNGGRARRSRGENANWRRTVSRIDESKAPGEALDETNIVVPLNYANDAQIESNCSPELSLELQPSQTSASNSKNCGSNLEKRFRDLKRGQ
jgi:hypothetical protein